MNTSFKILFSDRVIFVSLVLSAFLYVGSIAFVLFFYRSLPPFLPLYNKLAWGYARLGPTYEIAIPIGIPILLSGVNIFLEKYTYARTPLLARLLSLVSLLLALFTCIFIVKLVLIIV